MTNTELARRDLIRASIAAAAASAIAAAGRQARAAGPMKTITPARPARKKALFVYGGWEGHQPERCKDIFVPWLKTQGFEVVVSNNQEPYADPALMKTIDLIVQIWTMGTITAPQLKGLLEAVRDGAGIGGWHGGLGDAYRQQTEYQFMVGGQWVAHPGGQVDYRVNITDHEDPITAGISDFNIRSEQYYMHVDPNNKVLATTTFNGDHAAWIDGSTMPVLWKRVYGKGRVFYTSLGHQASVFDIPEAFEMVKRGLLWASDSKYVKTANLITPTYPAR